jgi:hypothetical protein
MACIKVLTKSIKLLLILFYNSFLLIAAELSRLPAPIRNGDQPRDQLEQHLPLGNLIIMLLVQILKHPPLEHSKHLHPIHAHKARALALPDLHQHQRNAVALFLRLQGEEIVDIFFY